METICKINTNENMTCHCKITKSSMCSCLSTVIFKCVTRKKLISFNVESKSLNGRKKASTEKKWFITFAFSPHSLALLFHLDGKNEQRESERGTLWFELILWHDAAQLTLKACLAHRGLPYMTSKKLPDVVDEQLWFYPRCQEYKDLPIKRTRARGQKFLKLCSSPYIQ